MSGETVEVVDRLFRVLVAEIEDRRPEFLRESFTVSRIYQDLVPYRTHRDRIGVQMNGDYEAALLRLLAGDGDYVRLESEAALRQLRDELESPNPDTGIYREFAAVEVRISPERLGEEDEEAGPGEGGGDVDGSDPESADEGTATRLPGSGTEVAGAEEGEARDGAEGNGAGPGDVSASAPEQEEGSGSTSAEEGDGDGEEFQVPQACPWCDEVLPSREDLRFCPFCGARADRLPCTSCGAELEVGWRFCIACGVQVDGD